MKLLIAILIIGLGAWQWSKRPKEPTAVEVARAEVILLATQWCGYCRLTRQLLKDNGVKYVEFDIEKSTEGKRRYDEIGGRGVPILVIRGKVFEGYDEAEILALIKS